MTVDAIDFDQFYDDLAQNLADFGNATNPETRSGTVGYLNENSNWVIPVPGEGARIYVTIGTGIVECLNGGVSLLGAYPVVVIFVPGREPVAARPESVFANEYMNGNTTLGSSPHSHRWGWANVDLVEGMRFEPGLTLPTDNGLEVSLTGFNYISLGVRYYFPTTNVTIVESPTAGKHRWAIVGVNTFATPHAIAVTYGDEQAVSIPLTQSDANAINAPGIPSVGVRVANGQTDLQVIDDFVDMRAYVADNQSGIEPLSEITITDSPYTPSIELNIYADTSGGDITVTLPSIATNYGRVYTVINAGSGEVIIDGYGAETINGEPLQTLYAKYSAVEIQATSQEWIAK